VYLRLQDSLALADDVIQGQRQVDDKDGVLTFYQYDIVSPVSQDDSSSTLG